MISPQCSKELLEQFDFGATLDSDLAFDPHGFPSSALPMIDMLENASQEGDILRVKETFAELRQILTIDANLHTGSALANAIDHHHEVVVAYPLSEGVQVSHYEVKMATLSRNKTILQLLFAQGWDINKALGWSDPPALAYAVEDIELTKWFLAHDADPNARCVLDMTPLSAAVQYAPLNVIKLLFDHGGSVEHDQLLHAAIWRELSDRTTVVDFVLSMGASVNEVMYHNVPEIYQMRKPFGLGTPLHDAAAIGAEELTRLLVSRGAKLDAIDSRGMFAYEKAEANGQKSTAQYLRATFDELSG